MDKVYLVCLQMENEPLKQIQDEVSLAHESGYVSADVPLFSKKMWRRQQRSSEYCIYATTTNIF